MFTRLRYELCSPIRLLLPVSGLFLALPCIFRDELMNFYSIPVFYFFGSYFFFLNFPSIGEILHGKPIYVQDLIVNNDNSSVIDHSFKKTYTVLMNFILAVLFSLFSEYILIKGIEEKPVVEILGIVGGNISLYLKAQNTIGKILLKLCYSMKEDRKRQMSEDLTVI